MKCGNRSDHAVSLLLMSPKCKDKEKVRTTLRKLANERSSIIGNCRICDVSLPKKQEIEQVYLSFNLEDKCCSFECILKNFQDPGDRSPFNKNSEIDDLRYSMASYSKAKIILVDSEEDQNIYAFRYLGFRNKIKRLTTNYL